MYMYFANVDSLISFLAPLMNWMEDEDAVLSSTESFEKKHSQSICLVCMNVEEYKYIRKKTEKKMSSIPFRFWTWNCNENMTWICIKLSLHYFLSVENENINEWNFKNNKYLCLNNIIIDEL